MKSWKKFVLGVLFVLCIISMKIAIGLSSEGSVAEAEDNNYSKNYAKNSSNNAVENDSLNMSQTAKAESTLEPVIYDDGNYMSVDEGELRSSNVTSSKLGTPELKGIVNYPDIGIKITWKKIDNASGYNIYRKTSSSGYSKIAQVEGASSTVYIDGTANKGYAYTYTVRAYDGEQMSGFDKAGIGTVKVDSVKIDKIVVGEAHICLEWTQCTGMTGYYVYRRIYGQAAWKQVAAVSSGSRSEYFDYDIVAGTKYEYCVQPYKIVNSTSIKGTQGYLPKSATAILETPIITGMKVNKDRTATILNWYKVPNATGYIIYTRAKATDNWTRVAMVDSKTVKYNVTKKSTGMEYYTVKAYKTVGKSSIYSSFETTVNDGKLGYSDEKALFLGDSITYGTVRGVKRNKLITYPSRIELLTGYTSDNQGVSGATLVKNTSTGTTNVLDIIKDKKLDFSKYKVISIAIGTNDYGFDTELGKESDMTEATFYGGLYQLTNQIKKVNPTAEVMFILPIYRNSMKSKNNINAYTTKNALGYTLQQYCDAITYWAKQFGAYIYDSKAAKVVNAKNVLVATGDGLHPNGITYMNIGNSVADFMMKNVFAYKHASIQSVTCKQAGSLSIAWNAVPDAKGYYVYRQQGTAWKKLADVKTTYYEDLSLAYGQSATYTIKAYKSNKNNKTVTTSFYIKGKSGKVNQK